MKKFAFVAWLYVASASCLLVGGVDLYAQARFWIDGQTGLMESSDPAIARTIKYGDPKGIATAAVTYVTPNERIAVPGKYLSYSEVQRLNSGEKIPVRFLKSDPRRALTDNQQLETPWGWLILALALLLISITAHRMLKREADH